MLNKREIATVLAALLYWKEEMCPHDPDVMRPYFEDLELAEFEPLSTDEIDLLMQRLRASLNT